MKEVNTPTGKYLGTWSLNDVFAQQFTGPFKAVADDGVTELPSIITHVRNESGKWEHHVEDHASQEGGKVIDSNGEVVAVAASHLAAHVIALTLNGYPTSWKTACCLGSGPFGSNTHTRESIWDFWCVQVDVESALPENPEVKVTSTRYIGHAIHGDYGMPACMIQPINACKHKTSVRAAAAIEILNDMLKKPCVQEKLARMKGVNIKWETMRPVKIHYLTVPADPMLENSYVTFDESGKPHRVARSSK